MGPVRLELTTRGCGAMRGFRNPLPCDAESGFAAIPRGYRVGDKEVLDC